MKNVIRERRNTNWQLLLDFIGLYILQDFKSPGLKKGKLKDLFFFAYEVGKSMKRELTIVDNNI